MYYGHCIHVLWTLYTCIVDTVYVYCGHCIHVLWMLYTCIVDTALSCGYCTHVMYCGCCTHVLWMLYTCIVDTAHMYCGHCAHVSWILYTHWNNSTGQTSVWRSSQARKVATPTTHSSWRWDEVAKPGCSGGIWTLPTPAISYISLPCVREKGRKLNYKTELSKCDR